MAIVRVIFLGFVVFFAFAMKGDENDEKGGNNPKHPPWTEEEIAMKKAEAWDDCAWPSPTSLVYENVSGWDGEWASPGTNYDGQPASADHSLLNLPATSSTAPAVTIVEPAPEMSAPSMHSGLNTGATLSSLPSSSSATPWGVGAASSSSSSSASTSTWDRVRAWTDYNWAGQPTPTSWDEELSVSLQDEELEALGLPERALLAPIPENVPLPFDNTPLAALHSLRRIARLSMRRMSRLKTGLKLYVIVEDYEDKPLYHRAALHMDETLPR